MSSDGIVGWLMSDLISGYFEGDSAGSVVLESHVSYTANHRQRIWLRASFNDNSPVSWGADSFGGFRFINHSARWGPIDWHRFKSNEISHFTSGAAAVLHPAEPNRSIIENNFKAESKSIYEVFYWVSGQLRNHLQSEEKKGKFNDRGVMGAIPFHFLLRPVDNN